MSSVGKADESLHRLKRRRGGIREVGPGSNCLPNDFRCREPLPASEPHNALARFFVQTKSEWGRHSSLRMHCSVLRSVIQGMKRSTQTLDTTYAAYPS